MVPNQTAYIIEVTAFNFEGAAGAVEYDKVRFIRIRTTENLCEGAALHENGGIVLQVKHLLINRIMRSIAIGSALDLRVSETAGGG